MNLVQMPPIAFLTYYGSKDLLGILFMVGPLLDLRPTDCAHIARHVLKVHWTLSC